jgi:hypothetical protein
MKKFMLLIITICFAAILNAQSNTGVIPQGTVLVKDKHYFSPNGKFSLCYQADGNLVVYKHTRPKNIVPLWNSGRYFSGKCIFQNDGNLVIYYDNGKAVWDAKDKWKDASGNTPLETLYSHELRVQDDGNVVIYCVAPTKPKPGYVAMFHTNTAGR